MTRDSVANSFIYNRWYAKCDQIGYYLTDDFGNMLMSGYRELFNRTNESGFIMPYQSISFYCINTKGYLKMFKMNLKNILDWSIKDMLNDIEQICIKNRLKFVSLWSKYYNYLWLEEFLGKDIKYEYDKNGDVILYV